MQIGSNLTLIEPETRNFVGCAAVKVKQFRILLVNAVMLAQRECKLRYGDAARCIHWRLCEKYKIHKTGKWYEHMPAGENKNDDYKILWDVMIQCDKERDPSSPTRHFCGGQVPEGN